MVGTLQDYVGPAAGIATSVLWTATSLTFTAAGKRLGPTVVNALRIVIAVVLLGVTHRLIAGSWIPAVNSEQLLLLAASGVIGLAVGDQALFTAFVDIGPRLSMLIMTTSPLMAAFFGWAMLGETLVPLAWVGVVITVLGVAWVVIERPGRGALANMGPHAIRGIFLALVGAACQAGGLLLSKQGMGHGWMAEEARMSPQAATLIRMAFAGLGVLPILVIQQIRQRCHKHSGNKPSRYGSRREGIVFTAVGAAVGPYLGVWMSLVASDRAPLGVAQTLCSLTPVFILPVLAIGFRQRISLRAYVGAIVAVGGSALLFFNPQ